jgi:hypothetical protein
MEDETLLNYPVILDTAGDLKKKITIRCRCGDTLNVRHIMEEPDGGIIIETRTCYKCQCIHESRERDFDY